MWTSRRSPAARLVALLVGVVVLVAGCGDEGGVSAGGHDGGDGRSLEGSYVATEVLEDGQARALVDGTTIRLRLADGRLTVSAGCNTIGGEHTVERGALVVSALSMTEMGCDPARHAQDEWLARFLSAEPALDPTGSGLTLRTDEVVITFAHEDLVEPDLELVGTTWVVDGYLHGAGPDGSASSAIGDDARVVFDRNGFVVGHDGCNAFGFASSEGVDPDDGLRYEVLGAEITFTGVAVATQIACPDVDTERFWAALEGTVAWEVDGSRLTLLREDGRGITLRVGGRTADG